jgi:hypothetical protein
MGLLSCGNNKFKVIVKWNVMVEWLVCTITPNECRHGQRDLWWVLAYYNGLAKHLKLSTRQGRLINDIGLEWCIIMEPHGGMPKCNLSGLIMVKGLV